MAKHKNRYEEKAELRAEVEKDILRPKKLTSKYTPTFFNKDIVLEKGKTVLPISIQRTFDNMLRNYAFAKDLSPSNRLDEFLKEPEVRKVLERYAQRPLTSDSASIRWHYSQENLTKLEACQLIVKLFPKKASPEIWDYISTNAA